MMPNKHPFGTTAAFSIVYAIKAPRLIPPSYFYNTECGMPMPCPSLSGNLGKGGGERGGGEHFMAPALFPRVV